MITSVQELHIKLDILIQKVNSNTTSYLEPEEKDVLLNMGLYDYIDTLLSKKENQKQEGLEDTHKRLQEIAPLIRLGKLQMYQNSIGLITDEITQVAFAERPFNYYRFASGKLIGYNTCTDKSYSTPTCDISSVGHVHHNIHTITFPIETIKGTATSKYYEDFQLLITVGGSDIALTPKQPGMLNASSRFSYTNTILDLLRNNETYVLSFRIDINPITGVQTLVFETNDATITGVKVVYNTTVVKTILSVPTNTYYCPMPTPAILGSKPVDFISKDQDGLFNMSINHYFNKAKKYKGTIYQDKINNTTNFFLITEINKWMTPYKLVLSYIKHPKQINIRTNQLCEQDLNFDKILFHAVKLFNEIKGDAKALQTTYQELLTN